MEYGWLDRWIHWQFVDKYREECLHKSLKARVCHMHVVERAESFVVCMSVVESKNFFKWRRDAVRPKRNTNILPLNVIHVRRKHRSAMSFSIGDQCENHSDIFLCLKQMYICFMFKLSVP